MRKTQKIILEQAEILFNRYGIRNTSMRMIADACGISVGNLTYHFPHKSDILDVFLNESFTDTYKNIDVQNFEDFENLLAIMLEKVEKHRFLGMDPGMEKYPQFRQNLRFLYGMLDRSIDNLQNNGLIRITQAEKEALVSMFMLSPITWVTSPVYVSEEGMKRETMLSRQVTLIKAFRTDKNN